MPGTVGRSGGDRKSGGMDLFPHDGMPQKPEGLNDDEKQAWDDLLDKLPPEMLRGVDCYQLTILARNIVCANDYAVKERMAAEYKEGLAYQRARVQAEAVVGKLSAQFGLTPRDRQGIKFEKKIQDDATEWMNE